MMKKMMLAFVATMTMFAFTACTATPEGAVDKVVKASMKVEKIAEEKGDQADFDKAVDEYKKAVEGLKKFDEKEYTVEQMEEIAKSGLRVAKAGVQQALPF
ncbi:hypothetical protein [Porphyromonas levii]|uniref:hypothetical protein n=1 Tax=Porphyromonas levii TaxID=28114 RepID=UPI000526CE73|nr:hypothetical protein [Porphyromonas levii]MBR8703193.1 hypothetical protein [Porphyromonas levii]MBR8713821.1 hypothetical protein [Porphyromonas levii]MBR8715661.1 hypothetical protein [Porphyromonas levii]MBR8728150.1 hypothetical protein [Porphyromonas levii]MBR8729888.1 hypothetical protein [Porphyromonas levii]